MKKYLLSLLTLVGVFIWTTTTLSAQDDCASATQITISDYCTTITGTTINDGTGGGIGTTGGDAAWFFLEAPSSADLTVGSCNGGADTEVALHKSNAANGCTSAANPATAYNDDFCATGLGNNFASEAGFSVSATNYAYIEWGDRWSNGPHDWYITYDCSALANVSGSAPSTTEAELAFDMPVDGSDVLIEYGPAGFAQGTGTLASTSASPFTISGLTECTDYDVYYYADCLGLGTFPPTGTSCTFNNVGMETITTLCACGTPTNLVVSDAVTDNEADATWMNGGGEGNYTIEWGPTGFTPGIGASIGTFATTMTSYTITGLNCGATYEVYVKDDCPVAGGTSAYLGPISVTIDCPPPPPTGVTCTTPGAILTTVFSDEFDATAAWTGNIGGGGAWNVSTAGTPSGGTGPAAPHSGTGYIHYEGTGSTADAFIVSTAIDLTNANDAVELSFFLHAFGNNIGTFNVGVGTAAAGPFTNEFSWSGAYQTANADAFVPVGVDLTAYIGQTIFLELSHVGISGFAADIAIDALEINTCATCTPPTAAFSVAPACATNEFNIKINVSDMGDAASYDVQDSGGASLATINATGNYTVGPFASATTENITLVHDSNNACDLTSAALTYTCPPPPPAGVTCTTPGANTIAALSDEMDNSPGGWTGDLGTANGQWDNTGAGTGSGAGTGPLGPHSGSGYFFYDASGNSSNVASLVSPAIDLTSFLDAAELSFYMFAFGADVGTLNVGIGTSAAGPFTTEWTWSGQWQTAQSDAWTQVGLNLDAYVGQTIYVEFSYSGAGTSFNGDMAIDLTEVNSCISCNQPVATFNTSPDCGNNQFFIDIDVTDLGDGAPYDVNDGTSSLGTINATGVTQVGPFADGTSVDLTLVHSINSGCDLSATGLSLTCFQSCEAPTVITAGYCVDVTGVAIADGTGSGVATAGGDAAWYSIDVPATATSAVSMEVSSCGGTVDTEVAVHDIGVAPGDCANTSNASPSDDDGCNLQSTVTIPVTAGNTYAIEWGDRWSNDAQDWVVNFTCDDGQVTGVTGTATGETTADLTFTSPGTSDVVIEYGTTGFTPGTGTVVTAVTSPFNITGLSACGVYDVYVNYDCLGTGTVESCIAELVTFSTDCPCPEPTGVTAADAAVDGEITASWTNGGGDGSYDLEWGLAGFAPGTGAEIGSMTSTNTMETITGLTCDTDYDVYVRDNCAGPPAGQSIWVVATTTVICPPPPPVGVTCTTPGANSGLVFSDEADAAGGWTGDLNAGNGSWVNGAAGTPSGGTGPDGAQSGTGYFFYESSGNSSVIASLVSPAIDLSAAIDAAELSFYMHAFGPAIGTLNVGIGTSAAGPFTTVWTWSGEWQTSNADAWSHVGINADAYVGQTIYVEFSYGGTGTDFTGDLAIDLLEVNSCLNCAQPSATFTVVPDCANNQFFVDINVTDLGDGAPYDVNDGTASVGTINALGVTQVGPFADGSSQDLTLVHASDNSCDLAATGLSATCGQDCITATELTTAYCVSVTGVAILDGTGSAVATAGGDAAWFTIDVPAGIGAVTMEVSSCGGTVDTEVAVHDIGAIPGDCANTSAASPSNDDGCALQSTLSTTVTGGNTYAIEWGDRWSNDAQDWEINFTCDDGQVTGEAGTATGETTADVTFTSPGASNVVLEYGPTGFTPGTGTLVATATSPYNITGLTACGSYDVYLNYDCMNTGAIDDCIAIMTTFSTDCPCGEPTGITAVDGAVDGEATISWTNGGGDGSYDVEWGLTGFAPGTGAEAGSITATANTSETITGLTCAADYDVYVRDNCAPSATSIWAGPVTWTVACLGESCVEPLPLTIDYCINITGSSVTDGNGSQVATAGDGALWYAIDIPAGVAVDMTVSSCNSGNVDTDVAVHNGGFIPGNCVAAIDPATGESDDACGLSSEVTLSVTAGNTYFIEWGDRWTNNAFDWEVNFTCQDGQVTALTGTATGETTADVTFTSPGASDVVLEYGPTGFTPGTGTLVAAATSPYNITGLTACGTYDVYVNYDCLGTGTIDDCIAEVITFATDCPCDEPTGLTLVDESTDGEATASWTNGGADGIYDLEWGAPGFAPGTGAELGSITGTTNTSETITGLICGDSYDVYVRDNCTALSASSIWTGPAQITLVCQGDLCAEPIPVTGYCEAFTGTTIDPNGSNVSTAAGNGAIWYSYTATADGTINVNSCNGGSDTQLAVHNLGAAADCANAGDANTVFNDDACATGAGNNFASEVVGYAVTAGNTYAIEWGDRWDAGPFDWSIEFTCLDGQVSAVSSAVTGETSADISFTSPGASNVVLEYGPTGFTPGTGTVVAAATSPYSITGLTTCTDYDVYINYDCLGTGAIDDCKAEMVSFMTDCPCGTASVQLPPMGATSTFNCVQFCEDGMWTYYRDPADPSASLFAIAWDPLGTGNNNAAKTGATVVIDVDANATMVDDGTEATWTMARYWNVIPSANLVDPVNVKFYYDPAEKTAIENAMNADGRNPEGFQWFKTTIADFDPAMHVTGPNVTGDAIELTPAGTGADNGIDYVQFDGITSFSGGTGATGVGPNTTPVPVELVYFTGSAEENGNLLRWQTATEINNDRFEIEASIDGNEFRKIGTVEGNGTTSEVMDYSFLDPTNATLTYYRLKQVDLDGTYEFTNVVIVRRSNGVSLINMYPNPSKGHVNLSINSDKNTEITIQATDVLGRVVSVQNYSLNGGNQNITLDYNHLAVGTYYITIDDGNSQIIEKWVKH